MKITNKTTYNDQLISEASKLLTKKYKIIVAAAVLIMIVMACYLGFTGSMSLVTIPVIGMVVVIAVGFVRVTNYKKMLLKRIKVLNQQDEVKCSYEIDSEKTIISSPNGTNKIYHSDIKKISETENMYMIMYSGGVFAILSKSGFEDDGESEFRKLHRLSK